MKRLWVLAFVGVLIAALSYVFGVWTAQRSAPPPLADLQDAAWLKKHLGLSEAQEKAVYALEEKFGAEVIALCGEHCSARNELASQLLRADWSEDVEQALLEDMGRAQIRTDAAILEHVRRVSRVLTPAQRARYQELVGARMHSACPHHLHHGAMAHTDGVH